MNPLRIRSVWLGLIWLGVFVEQTVAEDPVVVCHGDSITRGAHLPVTETYPAVLGTLLPGVKVVNTGIGGNTSRQGCDRFEQAVLSQQPTYVVLLFGTNDSVMTAPGRFRVSLNEFKTSLRKMVQLARAAHAEVVVCTLLPIKAEPYFQRHPKQFYEPEGGLPAVLDRYRAATIEVGRELKVPVIDLHHEFVKDLSLLRPAPDGVHPNRRGARRIAELVARELKRLGAGSDS